MTEPGKGPGRFEVIRDPLWDNIRLDDAAVAVLDAPPVQRLRYVRQLGHAFLVYPGATHSRFEHALGTYHLAKEALGVLRERGELAGLPESALLAVRLAALLHDIGHYPFSHGLEEAGFLHHEQLGVATLHSDDLRARIEALGGPDLLEAVGDLILGQSDSPLAGLISGSLDLDKIEYLRRDAWMCGVPYGAVDVDRLLASLTLCRIDGRLVMGIHEKGISALESLLFAKYQMYRNVYWHHAVRAATCMFKRAVRGAVTRGVLSHQSVARASDGELMEVLLGSDPEGLAAAVYRRRLYKRALDLPGSDLPADTQAWLWEDAAMLERAEDDLARRVGLAPGQLFVDLPARRSMLDVRLPLRTRDGTVEWLTGEGRAGELGLPHVATELYQSAQRLRVFVAVPTPVAPEVVLELVTTPAEALARRLAEAAS